MTAHTDYEQTKQRYLELVNKKKALEQAITANVNDQEALTALRADYRKVVDELETIYTENINYFN
ncbi:hypothetical protein [Nubsella zeaxanthinifaciens]|jgi:hypothetical protein|uniref:hypothetical protein n=1 Tax=Nubsella zeaxanthinifaciens TaxID=392412 RepID=UPI000DE328F3|nr:hypothetical protein [Nubsella zeaxanthinifaciens]